MAGKPKLPYKTKDERKAHFARYQKQWRKDNPNKTKEYNDARPKKKLKEVLIIKPKIRRTTDKRKAYQRNYYQAHKEKALAYQRLYNMNHKKKYGICGKGFFPREREARKESFTQSAIIRMEAGPRLVYVLNGILSGQFIFTG